MILLQVALMPAFPWTIPGGNGSGVKIYDIEYNWLQTHEDLNRANGIPLLLAPGDSNAPPGYPQLRCPAPCDSINREHGTAVLGELIADNNARGVTGISWGADIGLAPVNTTNRGYDLANAILLAVADGKPGDVILIEHQLPVCGLPDFGPSEWVQLVFDAIQHAVANRFVVVEAAGNGEVTRISLPAAPGLIEPCETLEQSLWEQGERPAAIVTGGA